MFKTETHLHVKEISRCGRLGAREMVEYYKAAGYHTIFVTDHRRITGNPRYAEETPTAEEVDRAIERLAAAGNRVDYILTHKYERGIDKNIAEELYRLCDYIEEKVEYKRWFYGHWHSENDTDPKRKQIFRTLRELR